MNHPTKNLDAWLDELASRHPQDKIRLGLESMQLAMARLELKQPKARVVTIAGTNGKGTTLMLLEAMLIATGVAVGSFQSPHISDFRERIRLNSQLASEQEITSAFELIDERCSDIDLTFFEWNTLAALIIFARYKPEIILLEVGLGGRLDAVNVIDNYLAVLTSIDWDHTEWLGDSLDKIAAEKAGVIRSGSKVVSHSCITTIVNRCKNLGVSAFYWQKDFSIQCQGNSCQFFGKDNLGNDVNITSPLPSGCIVDNLALALQAWLIMGYQLSSDFTNRALSNCVLPARQQLIRCTDCEVILDVAHNRASLLALAEKVRREYSQIAAVAVIGMLADKEAIPDIRTLFPSVQRWCIITLRGARGQSAVELATKLGMSDCDLIDDLDSLDFSELMDGKKLLIAMGSFHTCARVRSLIASEL